MRILTISDTHTKHKQVPPEWLQPADMIIHAGDVTNRGELTDLSYFLDWFSKLDYKYKIFIAGNHDWCFQDQNKKCLELIKRYNEDLEDKIIYLQDEAKTIEGIKFYGSPWQPEFCNWAFNVPRGPEIAEKWMMIPKDTDVLITHGPAYGFVDQVIGREEHLGCIDLHKRILEVKPRYHICGHIHSGYGVDGWYHPQTKEDADLLINHTTFINASVLNERYEIAYKPILINI